MVILALGVRKHRGIQGVLILTLLACLATLGLESTRAACEALQSSAPVVDGNQFDGTIFHPYDNAWSITTHFNDGTVADAGISSDHVRFITIGGKTYLSRLETTAASKGRTLEGMSSTVSTTYNVSDPASLRPLVGEDRSSDGDRVLRLFSGGHVAIHTQTTATSTVQTTEVALPGPLYDLRGGMAGLLLAALPLRVGLKVRIPNLNGKQYNESLVKVVGRESIVAGHLGRRDAWVLDIGEAGHVRYWVSKAAPYVLKVRISDAIGESVWNTI